MKFNKLKSFFILFIVGNLLQGQYQIQGQIDVKELKPFVYLSLVDDYRKANGIYYDQLISKVPTDKSGNFIFKGINLPKENYLYRVHVDNCSLSSEVNNQIIGKCPNSQYILFIANNKDTINLPLSSFENQMFCSINSTNKNTSLISQIDSIKNAGVFFNDELNSNANFKLNVKKWYNSLIEFGNKTNNPISKLYIYGIISDKSSASYADYLIDLPNNSFFFNLKEELEQKYPEVNFTKQYEIDLTSDFYISSLSKKNSTSNFWIILLLIALFICIILIFYVLYKFKKIKNKVELNEPKIQFELTSQEAKIVDLIKLGKSNKEISSDLFISISTVKTHVNNIFKKTGIQNRSDL